MDYILDENNIEITGLPFKAMLLTKDNA